MIYPLHNYFQPKAERQIKGVGPTVSFKRMDNEDTTTMSYLVQKTSDSAKTFSETDIIKKNRVFN
jgi:hypothetical protein